MNLDSKIVLHLNANYMRMGWKTPKEAFVAMLGGGNTPPALGLDISYNPDGSISHWQALPWEKWKELPVREGDMAIHTAKFTFRVPMVIVAPAFSKAILRRPKATFSAIYERDNHTCCYTGRKLTNKTRSIDHVIPKSRNGGNGWTNLVSCHKDVNFKKGNHLNEEVGLKLLKKPYEPKSTPLSISVKGSYHRDHNLFL